MSKETDICLVCEKPTNRTDLEYVELGKHLPRNLQRHFYACHDCAVKEKLAWYKLNFEQSREKIEALKAENNVFRTLMMKVETMAAIGNEPAISVKSYILQHRAGWEALPLDTLLLFLDLYRAHAEVFASLINKKASKDEIQAQLKKKTEDAKANDLKQIKEAKIKQNSGLVGSYTEMEKKAVLSLMKQFKIPEEKAAGMMRSMLNNK